MSKLRSMTGFCHHEETTGSIQLTIEIRSVNNRFSDFKIRLPKEFHEAELPLRSYLQSRFLRGSFDVKIQKYLNTESSNVPDFKPNLDLAQTYLNFLKGIQTSLNLDNDKVRVVDLVRIFPDIIEHSRKQEPLDSSKAWKSIESTVHTATDKLFQMREFEGAKIEESLRAQMKAMHTLIQNIDKKRTENSQAHRQKIHARITQLFETYPIEGVSTQHVLESRVNQEVALLLDRLDIEEELKRFITHLEHLESSLNEPGPHGKKFEFLLQELGREINTLGNKAQDVSISEAVVELKVRLEQIREQILNVE